MAAAIISPYISGLKASILFIINFFDKFPIEPTFSIA
jgi:hypothetical protein